MRKGTAGFSRKADNPMRAQFEQSRRRNKFAHKNRVVWKLIERGQRLGLQIVHQTTDDVVQIAATLAQIFIIQPIVCLKKIITDLLNCPFSVNAFRLDLFDNTINEQTVLQNE